MGEATDPTDEPVERASGSERQRLTLGQLAELPPDRLVELVRRTGVDDAGPGAAAVAAFQSAV